MSHWSVKGTLTIKEELYLDHRRFQLVLLRNVIAAVISSKTPVIVPVWRKRACCSANLAISLRIRTSNVVTIAHRAAVCESNAV